MKKLLLHALPRVGLILFSMLPCFAQQQVVPEPDCIVFFHFTATGQTSPTAPNAGFNNLTTGCISWSVTYSNTGFSALTLTMEAAPNVSGVAGAWVTFPGSVVSGSNPNTATSFGYSTFAGYVPWARMKLNASTGTGQVDGALFGFRSPTATISSSVAATQSGPWTVGESGIWTNRVVGNAGAVLDAPPGATAPANAVQTGGTDGTNTRVPFLDPCAFNAWTYYPINVSVNTKIASASGSTLIYVCEMFIAPVAGAASVNLVEGGGTVCATPAAGLMGGGAASLGATLSTNGGFVLPPSGRAWMKSNTTTDDFCIYTTALVTGVLAYVQF